MTALWFTSCTPTKKSVYFEHLQNDTTLKNVVTPNFDLKIQKDDLLGITVTSLSPDVAFYNGPQNSEGPLSGYLVDKNGNIPFVKVGPIHAEGMTRTQLKDTLQQLLVPYLKDVVVSVGFLNRHVTMLGGLTPAIIPMATDHMTIFDALAASGDIGVKGRIDNVLVIRQHGNDKDFERLNLKKSSVFYSPYFYLQPDDIVYVEPLKVKQPLTVYQAFSLLTTALSIYVIISKL